MFLVRMCFFFFDFWIFLFIFILIKYSFILLEQFLCRSIDFHRSNNSLRRSDFYTSQHFAEKRGPTELVHVENPVYSAEDSGHRHIGKSNIKRCPASRTKVQR